MVKEGAIVVDVGINRLENGKLVGDADFEDCKARFQPSLRYRVALAR